MDAGAETGGAAGGGTTTGGTTTAAATTATGGAATGGVATGRATLAGGTIGRAAAGGVAMGGANARAAGDGAADHGASRDDAASGFGGFAFAATGFAVLEAAVLDVEASDGAGCGDFCAGTETGAGFPGIRGGVGVPSRARSGISAAVLTAAGLRGCGGSLASRSSSGSMRSSACASPSPCVGSDFGAGTTGDAPALSPVCGSLNANASRGVSTGRSGSGSGSGRDLGSIMYAGDSGNPDDDPATGARASQPARSQIEARPSSNRDSDRTSAAGGRDCAPVLRHIPLRPRQLNSRRCTSPSSSSPRAFRIPRMRRNCAAVKLTVLGTVPLREVAPGSTTRPVHSAAARDARGSARPCRGRCVTA